MTRSSCLDRSSGVVVVSAADDGYAMPLAVTIRSALDFLDNSRGIKLFVLDGGLSDENKARLLRSWDDDRLQVQWVTPDLEQLRDVPLSGHASVAAYLRLLMPVLLPDVPRAIYLDADMIVQRDLTELWREEQGGYAALAVQDIAAPLFDSATSLPNYHHCRDYIVTDRPIANYRELGLPAAAKYFNSGVLVADLAHWRREDYAAQMLKCLRENREHVMWWDQYALNVVLAGKWRALDFQWNQSAQIHNYPSWRDSPLNAETFDRLRLSPWIVHFCSPSKPWHYFCRHPATADFCRYVTRTEWAGWTPQPPGRFLRRWWAHHYKPLRGRVRARLRETARVLRPNHDRAA